MTSNLWTAYEAAAATGGLGKAPVEGRSGRPIDSQFIGLKRAWPKPETETADRRSRRLRTAKRPAPFPTRPRRFRGPRSRGSCGTGSPAGA